MKEGILERSKRIHIQVICRFVQQQQISAALQYFCQMNAVAFPSRQIFHPLLLIRPFEIKGRGIGSRGILSLAEDNVVALRR